MNQSSKADIAIPPDLMAEAEALGIDIEQTCATALESAVRQARREKWKADNREAFASFDRYVERHGVFSDGKRLF